MIPYDERLSCHDDLSAWLGCEAKLEVYFPRINRHVHFLPASVVSYFLKTDGEHPEIFRKEI